MTIVGDETDTAMNVQFDYQTISIILFSGIWRTILATADKLLTFRFKELDKIFSRPAQD